MKDLKQPCPKGSGYHDPTNRKVIGKAINCDDFVGIYGFLDDDDDNDKNSFKKAKGVKKSCV